MKSAKYCTKRRYSEIKPLLKVEIEDGRESLVKIKIKKITTPNAGN